MRFLAKRIIKKLKENFLIYGFTFIQIRTFESKSSFPLQAMDLSSTLIRFTFYWAIGWPKSSHLSSCENRFIRPFPQIRSTSSGSYWRQQQRRLAWDEPPNDIWVIQVTLRHSELWCDARGDGLLRRGDNYLIHSQFTMSAARSKASPRRVLSDTGAGAATPSSETIAAHFRDYRELSMQY